MNESQMKKIKEDHAKYSKLKYQETKNFVDFIKKELNIDSNENFALRISFNYEYDSHRDYHKNENLTFLTNQQIVDNVEINLIEKKNDGSKAKYFENLNIRTDLNLSNEGLCSYGVEHYDGGFNEHEYNNPKKPLISKEKSISVIEEAESIQRGLVKLMNFPRLKTMVSRL